MLRRVDWYFGLPGEAVNEELTNPNNEENTVVSKRPRSLLYSATPLWDSQISHVDGKLLE
jgi:hypothetical protein